MEFGKVLKQIRISRNLKQTDLSQDFLSRTSISKIENGKQIPAYDTAVKLINNLGLTPMEFDYIASGYKWDKKQLLINEFIESVQYHTKNLDELQKKCQNYLEFHNDTDIFHIRLTLLSLLEYNHNISVSTENAALVWSDLEKFNTWNKLDLFLINSILETFPTATAINISKYALNIVIKKYPHLKYLQASLLSNCAKMLMADNNFMEAKIFFSQTLPLYQALFRYDLLLLTKLYLSLCDNNFTQAQEYLSFLKNIGATTLADTAYNEFVRVKKLRYKH